MHDEEPDPFLGTEPPELTAEAQAYDDGVRDGREEQSAKLERAMAVVDSCIGTADALGICECCGYIAGKHPHDNGCPLVAQGFIDKEGRRL